MARKALAIFMAFWAGLTLLTLGYYPVPGMDEIMFLDPAINLAWGKGFFTGYWPAQPVDQLFSAYPPLYILLESLWVSVWGLSPLAVRSLSILFAGLATWLLTWYGYKQGYLPRQKDQLLFAALILLSYGFAFSYRSGRPEAFVLLVLSGAWILINQSNWTSKSMGGLVLLGMLGALTGLQVSILIGLAGMSYLFQKLSFSHIAVRFKRLLFWGAGACLGLG
ncbi:MAG: hypothetical protein AAFV07_02860, partial [Bacteroidota bacterium]